MTAKTRFAALEAENARSRAGVAAAHETIATLSAPVTALLDRVKSGGGAAANG